MLDSNKPKSDSNSLSKSEAEFNDKLPLDSRLLICRTRNDSDTDSEDSFIIFEDDENCSSNSNCDNLSDSEEDSESESSESESDAEDDSPRMRKGFNSIEDNSDEEADEAVDEVDCAAKPVIYVESADEDQYMECTGTGLLIDARKKRLRRKLPPKKVHFSTLPPKVHVMRVWAVAARIARTGTWLQVAIDRERFERRICIIDTAVSWVLKPEHRMKVMSQRTMTSWGEEIPQSELKTDDEDNNKES